jgi:hypothetical protein
MLLPPSATRLKIGAIPPGCFTISRMLQPALDPIYRLSRQVSHPSPHAQPTASLHISMAFSCPSEKALDGEKRQEFTRGRHQGSGPRQSRDEMMNLHPSGLQFQIVATHDTSLFRVRYPAVRLYGSTISLIARETCSWFEADHTIN